jgi:hypothetical protein
VGPAGEEAAAGVTAARCARGMREGRGWAASWAQSGGRRGGELGRGIAGPRREGGKGGGGKAGWAAGGGGVGGGGPKAGWASRPAGPRAKAGGWAKRRGKGGERKEKDFPFSNIYFLYECFHTFKQSKKCMVRHGAANE